MKKYVPPKLNPRRDKRYTTPTLSIDLFEKAYPTAEWDMGSFHAPDYVGHLTEGEQFTGFFSVSGSGGRGLFTGRVTSLNDGLRADFLTVNPEGQAMMGYVGKDGEKPMLTVTMAYPTIDWSLSGFLVEHYTGDAKQGGPIRGLIYIERMRKSGTFDGGVIRADLKNRRLAVRFTNLPSATFDLLEKAVSQVLRG